MGLQKGDAYGCWGFAFISLKSVFCAWHRGQWNVSGISSHLVLGFMSSIKRPFPSSNSQPHTLQTYTIAAPLCFNQSVVSFLVVGMLLKQRER